MLKQKYCFDLLLLTAGLSVVKQLSWSGLLRVRCAFTLYKTRTITNSLHDLIDVRIPSFCHHISCFPGVSQLVKVYEF